LPLIWLGGDTNKIRVFYTNKHYLGEQARFKSPFRHLMAWEVWLA